MSATIHTTATGYDVIINGLAVHCHRLTTAVRYCRALGIRAITHEVATCQ